MEATPAYILYAPGSDIFFGKLKISYNLTVQKLLHD